jgi:ribosomal protein L24
MLTIDCVFQIVVLGGPDKGKTGKLIGIDDTKGVIKLDTNGKFTEVKIITLTNIGKQLLN